MHAVGSLHVRPASSPAQKAVPSTVRQRVPLGQMALLAQAGVQRFSPPRVSGRHTSLATHSPSLAQGSSTSLFPSPPPLELLLLDGPAPVDDTDDDTDDDDDAPGPAPPPLPLLDDPLAPPLPALLDPDASAGAHCALSLQMKPGAQSRALSAQSCLQSPFEQ